MFGASRRIAAVIGLVALGIAAAAAQELPSFKGKTITMLIGDDPGGGTDVTGRLIALYRGAEHGGRKRHRGHELLRPPHGA